MVRISFWNPGSVCAGLPWRYLLGVSTAILRSQQSYPMIPTQKTNAHGRHKLCQATSIVAWESSRVFGGMLRNHRHRFRAPEQSMTTFRSMQVCNRLMHWLKTCQSTPCRFSKRGSFLRHKLYQVGGALVLLVKPSCDSVSEGICRSRLKRSRWLDRQTDLEIDTDTHHPVVCASRTAANAPRMTVAFADADRRSSKARYPVGGVVAAFRVRLQDCEHGVPRIPWQGPAFSGPRIVCKNVLWSRALRLCSWTYPTRPALPC